MNDANYRLSDIIVKSLSAVIALSVAVAGLFQYRAAARNNSFTQELEQKKLNFEINRQKADILSRAARAAADATWTEDKVQQINAINQFTRLFVGELSLVANKEVIDMGDRLNERLDEIHGFIDQKYGAKQKYGKTLDGELDPIKQKEAYQQQTRDNLIKDLNAFVDVCRKQIESMQ